MNLKEGQKITVEGVAVYRDGGDGGGGFTVYRDEAELLEELREDYDERWSERTPEEELEVLRNGDEPYETGELTSAEIELVVKNGKLELSKSFYLHWGQ